MKNFGVPKGGMMSPGEAATHAATEGRAISPVTGAVAPLDEARNANSKYRLLDDSDTIEGTDEGLNDNCTEWETMIDTGRWFIGCRYNRNFFVPMRRPVSKRKSPNDQAQARRTGGVDCK